eukprot:3687090-Rhodomonas_salina.1
MERYATASKSGQTPRLSNTRRHGWLSSAQSQDATRQSPSLPQLWSQRSLNTSHVLRSQAFSASTPASSNRRLHASPLKLHAALRHAPLVSHVSSDAQTAGHGSESGSNTTAARSKSAIPPPSFAALQFSTTRFASADTESTDSWLTPHHPPPVSARLPDSSAAPRDK